MSDVAYDPFGSRNAGLSYGQRLSQMGLDRRAGSQLAAGNSQAAANTLFGGGDLQGGMAVRSRAQAEQLARQTQVTADQARLAQFTLQAAKTLKNVPDAQRASAYATLAPTLRLLGQTDQDINAFGQALQQNPALIDQAEQWAGQTIAAWEFKQGPTGDIVAVRQGADGNPETRVAFDAPDRPISTPYGIILPPQSGSQPTQGNLPQATGSAISSDPLWSRQVQQESGGQQFAANGQPLTSPAGAFGVAQLMPGTASDMARQMGVSVDQLRSDPALNEAAGRRYMDQQLQKYGGDQVLALAAYNAGPGRVDEWIKTIGDPRTGQITSEEFAARIPFSETRDYVSNILGGQAQGDEGGNAGQTTSGLQQLGGGYTLQQMQTPADTRADRAEARMDRNERRSIALENRRARTLTPEEVSAQGFPEGSVVQERPDGSLNVVSGAKSEKFTQDQRTTAGFAYRLENATRTLDRLAQQGVERPSPAILAFGEGRIRENALSQNDRRWLQAAREWLAPVLRRDTGAAVSPGELVTYMNTYLASPTDDPGTLAQKAQARLTAEQAMRGMAGGAYSELVTNIQGQGGATNQSRRPQTNTGVVPFDLAPAQLETWRNLGRNGGDPSRPRGDRLNPIPLNPAPNASARSWQNIPSGAYFIHPDGTTRRKP